MPPLIDAEFGPRFPRRGNALSRWFGRCLLRLFGWRIIGSPPDCEKMIVIAAPHTSNWDGFFMVWAMMAANLDLRWVAKHTLFQGPKGRFFRWAGGVPVNRAAASDFVGAVAQRFQDHSQLALVIAPEGTRKRTTKWKSGFHRIAQEANVPIVAAYMNYADKTVGFGPGIDPNRSFTELMEELSHYYLAVTPRHPERFALPDEATQPDRQKAQ